MSRLLNKFIGRAIQVVTNRLKRLSGNDRFRVYLAHDAFAVCHLRGRFRPAIVAKATVPITVGAIDQAPGIDEALAMLSAWLDGHAPPGTIEWIIGIDHVRYLSLPWDERLSSDAFSHALAQALFAQQAFGNDSRFSSCELRFAPLSYGRARLVAFVPVCVIRALTSWSDQHRCRTTKITPALAMVWDSFLHHFRKTNGTLAIVEGTRLQNVTYDHGTIMAVTVRPINNDAIPTSLRASDFVFPATYARPGSNSGLTNRQPLSEEDTYMVYALCGAL